jgi:hypothetical protein
MNQKGAIMRKMLSCWLIAMTIVTLGCAPPMLKPSAYEKAVAVQTNLSAAVILQSQAKASSKWSDPSILEFNLDDQRIFTAAFTQEIERLGLFKTAHFNETSAADVQIKVAFIRTSYRNLYHIYTLDVVMEITGENRTFSQRYSIVSSGRDSWNEMMSTNAADGKAKAGKYLMSALVEDVEKWLSAKK